MRAKFVYEDYRDILKPKSEKEIGEIIKQRCPIFVKIFNEMFPNEKYNINWGPEGMVNISFAFNETDREGNEYLFLISQHYLQHTPHISFLDRNVADGNISGVFTKTRPIRSIEDVNNYVNTYI